MSSQMTENLTERRILSKFNPHESQRKIRRSNKRFNIVIAGRRFGKSVLAVNQCIEKALRNQSQKIWYCSPLYKQTKEIAWNLFDFYCPKEFIEKKNEAELRMLLINGSEISLKGTDNPDSLVGVGLNFCVMDEFPLMDETVWYRIVRPMLIDTKGEALFIGTPRGFNWAYTLWKQSEKDSDFERFHFKTVDNTAIEDMTSEVDKAKAEASSELDRIVFRQEYEATFENVVGRPRFDIDVLTRAYTKTVDPLRRDGLLNIYEEPNKACAYVLGVDTSEGLATGDNSSVVILNARDYSVSAHYSGKIPPDKLAYYIAEWGKMYGEGLIVVESNNHGLVTLNYLRDIYNNLYYKKQFDKVANTWTQKLGFRTDSATKPLLISKLDRAIRSGLSIPSQEILDELRAYIIEDDGSTNAAEGSHDDSVIALALSVQGYEELGTLERVPQKDKPEVGSLGEILETERLTNLRKKRNGLIWRK